MRIKLVEASDRVLMMFDEALQDEAVKALTAAPQRLLEQGLIAKDMTEVLLKVGVKEVKEREIELSDGRAIPYGLAVWAAGGCVASCLYCLSVLYCTVGGGPK